MRTPRLFIAILFFTVGLSFSLSAQEAISYETKNDILYREGDELTDYMKDRCHLDIYYPANKVDFTTIIWFHGGGITGGEKFVPDEWKNKGVAVVAVNYRLSPKVKCPEYIEDAAAAVAWGFHHIAEYGGSAERIVVSGHSAGGYLASMVGLDKHYLEAFGVDADKIAALVPFSGHTITHFTIRSERGIPGTQPIVDEYAPLYFVRPDAPPLYLITGDRELEMLGRYEENAYMYRMMKVAGHQQSHLYEMDGFDHGSMPLPAYPLTLRILKELDLL
ncbi:alpha/beta hydrolase [Mangrovibacterium lignilyticum]|uniref:alpha/beta hydrolase n=1 Tax=Mangrovibacterium lignilyticum TaxID=2668052 RepID=UPI0013CFE20F|nr:alpha/beta hydrolase [Mangrovibacterium lignilyticum]